MAAIDGDISGDEYAQALQERPMFDGSVSGSIPMNGPRYELVGALDEQKGDTMSTKKKKNKKPVKKKTAKKKPAKKKTTKKPAAAKKKSPAKKKTTKRPAAAKKKSPAKKKSSSSVSGKKKSPAKKKATKKSSSRSSAPKVTFVSLGEKSKVGVCVKIGKTKHLAVMARKGGKNPSKNAVLAAYYANPGAWKKKTS